MRRVLFVDDEHRILESLQDLLRKYRHQMEMVFALGGDAALSELSKAPFDVIVSDMRMPGMDGAVLLRKVKERNPEVARIILSGHADRDAIFMALSVSHQFLSKPCDADKLCEVIERACKLRALLTDESLRKAVGGIEKLPSVPVMYQKLMTVMAGPEGSMQAITDIIEQDPAMCAKVLQLVNSACFGSTRPIARIDRAVTHLGMDLIKNLALTVHVFEGAAASLPGVGISPEKHQEHAILTAKVAKELLSDPLQAELAFTGGLLHDIGKIILSICIPDRVRAVVDTCRRTKRSAHEVEMEILGVSHAEIGAYLLDLWGLPHPIVEAVAGHHEQLATPGQATDARSAVCVANQLLQSEPVLSP